MNISIGTEITELSKEIHCIDISKQETVDNIYINIDISENGYIISPKQYLLVSLRETLKVPDDITVHLRPKTRYTRLGLLVTDQHCNSTYSGHLRIGLFNATEYPIHIYPDYTIAQLVFEELEEVPSSEKLYKNREDVHYQNENGAFRGAKFDDKFLDSIWDEMLN